MAAITASICRDIRRRDSPCSAEGMADAPKARVVVLGAGWWTQGWHLPHLQRHADAEVVAVVDPCANPRSAISTLIPLKELGAKYGCATFESFDACLDSGLEFDGVIVCTSHASHSQLGARFSARKARADGEADDD